MSDLLTDAELRSRTWPLPAPVLKHIDTLAARVAELVTLLKEAAEEDGDCHLMGTDWHGKVRAALADGEKQ